ncbi:ChaN family lipoprotein [Pedobacter fastidiosus]|uniref:ChaN family lipoprotein n=1 Tax=Pedobacter fastidiosus TaxID=2765361 RepID=A0ABR7KVE1_9SPHI|nr:ChaN family lipoprotein [Pedobacter fastidiosus]MBC6112037.1 ChaN family lipoprotein [Pedobacter fastidiosus]
MKILLLIIAITLPFGIFAQNINPTYKVYDVKKQKLISLDDIVSDMSKADVLFLGEEHNDSIGHFLEAELFKKLNEKYPQHIALSLEMFHTDVQPIVNEYLAGVISEKNFIKESRAWGNYKDYRPAIEYAKQNKLSVIAANAAARYSNAVTMGGLDVLKGFPESSKAFLPPIPVDTATGRYNEKFTETLGGHNMGSMKIYQTQNFWDATMAWSMAKFAKANKGIKIFQLNGRFHSDEKLGTLAKLQKYAPKLKILNISSFSDESFDKPDWGKFKTLGDYIIITDPKIKRS